jgi:hypothetical protein
MPAEIQVHSCMSLAGRGAVLIGFVRSGKAVEGQTTEPISLGGLINPGLKVIAVERLSSMGSGFPAVGLTFADPPTVAAFREALPAGTLLQLEDPA